MASTSLGFSDFSSVNNNEKFATNTKKRKNKTIKKKSSSKVREFLNSMEGNSDDDGSNLANFDENFTPPPMGELTKQPDQNVETLPDTDASVGVEEFSKISRDEASNMNYQNYYNTYVPYYSKPSNQANLHGSRDELMKKLNYMIHLLEETKDEKTQNVTEELVLYMFLGVFTIFVVDSFARAGKYTR